MYPIHKTPNTNNNVECGGITEDKQLSFPLWQVGGEQQSDEVIFFLDNRLPACKMHIYTIDLATA